MSKLFDFFTSFFYLNLSVLFIILVFFIFIKNLIPNLKCYTLDTSDEKSNILKFKIIFDSLKSYFTCLKKNFDLIFVLLFIITYSFILYKFYYLNFLNLNQVIIFLPFLFILFLNFALLHFYILVHILIYIYENVDLNIVHKILLFMLFFYYLITIVYLFFYFI